MTAAFLFLRYAAAMSLGAYLVALAGPWVNRRKGWDEEKS